MTLREKRDLMMDEIETIMIEKDIQEVVEKSTGKKLVVMKKIFDKHYADFNVIFPNDLEKVLELIKD